MYSQGMSYEVNPVYERRGLLWRCSLWITPSRKARPGEAQPMYASSGPTFLRERNAQQWVAIAKSNLDIVDRANEA